MREPGIQTGRAYRAWIAAKEQLRGQMQPEDYKAFVRPMMLLAVLSQRYFLLALPPNNRIIERAKNFAKHGPFLSCLNAQGYGLAGFTVYPSDEELPRLASNPVFEPWMTPILRERLRKLEARCAAENARDRRSA